VVLLLIARCVNGVCQNTPVVCPLEPLDADNCSWLVCNYTDGTCTNASGHQSNDCRGRLFPALGPSAEYLLAVYRAFAIARKIA
jgi:hypothetical protein